MTCLTALGGIVENFVDFASRPSKIFPRLIQNIFIFVIPILLATNISVDYLRHGIDFDWVYYLDFIVVLYFFSKFLWKKGLGNMRLRIDHSWFGSMTGQKKPLNLQRLLSFCVFLCRFGWRK